MRSHYDVLGVETTASREEIRHAYRRLVRELHPDRHHGLSGEAREAMTRRLVAVTDAWRVLGDEDRRALYDQVWQAAARRALLVAGGRVIRPQTPPPRWVPPTWAPPPPGPSRRPAGRVTAFPGSDPATAFPGSDRATAAGAAAPPAPPATGVTPAGHAVPSTSAGAVTPPWPDTGGAVGPAADRWGGPWPPPPPPPSAATGPAPRGVPAGHHGFRPGQGPVPHATVTGRGPGVAGWPAADSGRGEPRRQWRDRQSNECRLCGSAPAVPVDLRPQSSGLLRTLYTGGGPVERGPLCRSCGLAVLRDLTDVALCGGRPTGRFGDRPNHRTLVADVLVLGWLRNLLTVIGNLSFWVTLRRLGPPVRDPRVRSPLIAPLEPGPSLWARRGGAVVLVVLGLALMVGLVLVAVRLGLGGGGHPLVVLVQHNGWSYFSRTARLPG